jgi:hypothetical protein
MSGSCCTLTRIGAPPAAAAGKASPPAASKQAGASAAAGSCPPGTRVDATANIDQRQPAGTCSSRGMSRAQCTDAGGHHFKPDSGSGFTECFFRPRADAPPPPQKSAKPHPPAPAQDNSGTSGADARPPSGSGEDVPTEAARAECSDDLPGSLYTTGPVEFYCRHDETAHLQGKEVRRRFVAIACGRGADERFARHNAAARAKERVFGMQIATARALGADAGRNEIFITDKTELVCTRSKM